MNPITQALLYATEDAAQALYACMNTKTGDVSKEEGGLQALGDCWTKIDPSDLGADREVVLERLTGQCNAYSKMLELPKYANAAEFVLTFLETVLEHLDPPQDEEEKQKLDGDVTLTPRNFTFGDSTN